MSLRSARLAGLALPLLLAASGCSGFSHLRADDVAVGEDEVAAAGEPGAPKDLGPHLVRIVEERDRRKTAVVVAALAALAARKDAEAVPAIAKLSSDPDEEVRWHAARALAAIGGADARAALDRMAQNDPSELVREAATSSH